MAKKAIMSDAMFTVVRAPFGRWVLYRELIFNLTGVQADPAIIQERAPSRRKQGTGGIP